MTNAEKYLKDGKATEELIGEMEISLCVPYYEVARFWNKQIKPTLTENERVILRNIDKKYKYISRNCDTELFLKNKDDDICRYVFRGFNHLFQFIKERRRIFY